MIIFFYFFCNFFFQSLIFLLDLTVSKIIGFCIKNLFFKNKTSTPLHLLLSKSRVFFKIFGTELIKIIFLSKFYSFLGFSPPFFCFSQLGFYLFTFFFLVGVISFLLLCLILGFLLWYVDFEVVGFLFFEFRVKKVESLGLSSKEIKNLRILKDDCWETYLD